MPHVTNANWEKILKSVPVKSKDTIQEDLNAAREKLQKIKKQEEDAERELRAAEALITRLRAKTQKRTRTEGGGRSRRSRRQGRSRRIHVKPRRRTAKNRSN
jgi:F0F1-type ATP synthase membrane subunit b/b'